MRAAFILPSVALVAACSSGGEEQPQAQAGAETIDCAIGPGGEFGPDCMVEKATGEDGERLLVVRHPDGGFRRFEQLDDGRGLRVVDGSDEAVLNFANGILTVEVAGDAYRFPANPVDTTEAGDAPAE